MTHKAVNAERFHQSFDINKVIKSLCKEYCYQNTAGCEKRSC